jgi:hypothetical protein
MFTIEEPNIERFIEFLREIAADDSWEYEDGTPMQADAQAFLDQWYMAENIANSKDE